MWSTQGWHLCLSMDHSHAKTCLVMLMLGFLKVWPVFSFKSLGSITENDEPCPLYCQNSLQSLVSEYPSQPGLVYSPCLLHTRTTLPITLDFHILKILNCFALHQIRFFNSVVQRKKVQKSKIAMEVGGWVQVEFFWKIIPK